ncbi:MAG: ATP-binding protein, partial [Nannocystaceae bacterium]
MLPNYEPPEGPLRGPEAKLRHLVTKLCERLERSEELRRYITLDDRLDQMLGVVTRMAVFDFSTKVDVFEGDDWSMNALAIGLNMLGEELENSTRQLTRTRNHALAANQAKSSFLANMSHELRTPLNAIIGYSELIREELPEGVGDETAQDLEYVLVAARHLLNLINDTLDLAKIESGKMKLRPVHVDLYAMLTGITGTLMPMAKARDTTLSWSIDPELSGVLTDGIKLQQVLFNLVSNALKFTHNGSVNIEVCGEHRAAREWILIRVSDSGIGIPADKIEIIFKAFRQVDEGSARTFQGSGLGLAISRHYCTMMGGGLDVISEPGEGSTFTVRIPKVLELSPQQDEQLQPPTRYALILDADPESRCVARDAAESLGYWVSFANTHNIVELSQALRPGLVILDVANVATDGWKLLASLKSFPELEQTRFCVVTEAIDRKRAFALGVMDNLHKPVSRAKLREYLARRDAVASARVALCFLDRALADTIKRQFEGAGLMTELVTRGVLTSDSGLAGISALVVEADAQYPV